MRAAEEERGLGQRVAHQSAVVELRDERGHAAQRQVAAQGGVDAPVVEVAPQVPRGMAPGDLSLPRETREAHGALELDLAQSAERGGLVLLDLGPASEQIPGGG